MTVETNKKGKGNFKKGNKPMKKKIEMAKYTKSFTEFKEGFETLADMHEKLADLFDQMPNDIAESNAMIIDILRAHRPNKETRENMLWEFHVSANATYVKTDFYIGFGYKPIIGKIQDQDVKNFVFSIDVYGDRQQDLIDRLEETGWEKFEYKKPAPRKQEDK